MITGIIIDPIPPRGGSETGSLYGLLLQKRRAPPSVCGDEVRLPSCTRTRDQPSAELGLGEDLHRLMSTNIQADCMRPTA